ncbi:MAG: hypothetical protein ACXW30_01380 [Micavibrio sp.]
MLLAESAYLDRKVRMPSPQRWHPALKRRKGTLHGGTGGKIIALCADQKKLEAMSVQEFVKGWV